MAAGGRLQSVDVYRGLALLAMAAYHTIWDLAYYGLVDAGIGIDPVWITIQRSILTAFLLLTGASLTLAHGNGIKWRKFWRREAIVIAAALAVTAGTWFAFGEHHEYVAYFGVLHLIALSALLALPFIFWPLWVGAVVAAIVLFAPALWSSELFDPRWLDWIGFFRTTPETADLVPVFPWFGVVLIGILGTRIMRESPAFTWSSENWVVRALALLGRWSLLFYLVHQPIIFGVVTPIAGYLQNAEQAKLESFMQSCKASCGATNDAPYCTTYCQCALDMTVRDNLWGAPQSKLETMSKMCTAMSGWPTEASSGSAGQSAE